MPIFRYAAAVRSIGLVLVVGCATTGLLLSGCSKDDSDGNPLVNHPVVVTKSGVISSAEEWNETGKVYRITADCSIEAQVTWGHGITVVVDPSVVIHIANNGILTIGEAVTVRLSTGAYIEAGDNSPGKLIAAGTASGPIVFKADTGSQVWGLNSASRSGGILLGDSSNSSLLRYCTITGAAAGIYIRAGTSSIINCKVSSCKGDGIYFDSTAGPGDSSTFTSNTISDCDGYPLTLSSDKLGNLSGEIVFSGSTTGKKAIHVMGAAVEDSAAIWRKKTLPYVFSGTTLISSFNTVSSVTIMPGVICKFETGAFISIGDPRFGSGTLIARGTSVDSIFFVNNLPNTVWGDSSGGICVGMESPLNTILEYCSIQKATTGIFVNPGVKVTVSHCRVTGCNVNGITFAGGSPVDSIAFIENSCIENTGYGISITADQLVNLSGSGSVVGNGKGGIYVSGAEVWQSGKWKKYDAPYIVDGAVDIGTSKGVEISIPPGTEFDFLSGACIRVGHLYPGTFLANGTGDSPIVFTSAVQGTYWGTEAEGAMGGGIRIEQFADAKTALASCKVLNATSGIYVNANVRVQNCVIQNNQFYGLIRDKNAGSALITENSYSGNGVDSTYVVP